MGLVKNPIHRFGCVGIKGKLAPQAIKWFEKFGFPELKYRPDRDGIMYRHYRYTPKKQPYKSTVGIFINNCIFPSNPRTPAQQHRRGMFRDGVAKYQVLSAVQKTQWDMKAHRYWPGRYNFGIPQGISGFNLFMSEYMKGRIT